MTAIATRDLVRPATRQRDAARAERALPIGDWADRNLMLPRGSGVARHDQSITPYWRHPHRIVRARITGEPTGVGANDEHLVERITVVCASQVGKTYGLLVPTLAWVVAVHPRDLGVVLPSHDSAKAFARNKLRRCFDESTRLAQLLPAGQSAQQRQMGIKAWLLDRMTLHFLNGAVAMDLRSNDIPLLLPDEFDALPNNVDGEGSPIGLMSDRQKTFPHERLLCQTTTPTTVSGLGWSQLVAGTHERLLLACLGCGAHDYLDPDRLVPVVAGMTPDQIQADDAARWRCPRCTHLHTSDDRDTMVAAACAHDGWTPAGGWVAGHWEQQPDGAAAWTPAADIDPATGRVRAIVPASGQHRSLWINALYSRYITLGRFLANELRANAGSTEDRQAHINGWRAEPFNARTDSASPDDIARVVVRSGGGLDGYQHGQFPAAAWKLVLTCDQQGVHAERSWFPFVLRAWQQDGSSYLVEAGQVEGFDALEQLAAKTWPIGGAARKVDLIAIDTANGTMIRPIRQWCAREPRRRVSLSGSGTMSPDTPWAEITPSAKNAPKLCGLPVVYYHNAHLFRDDLYERIRGAAGAAPWHLPSDAPGWYRDSLTSEERIPQETVVRGRPMRRLVWVPRRWTDPQGREHVRGDNHWWDCEVQQLALVTVLGWYRQAPRSGVSAVEYVSRMVRR